MLAGIPTCLPGSGGRKSGLFIEMKGDNTTSAAQDAVIAKLASVVLGTVCWSAKEAIDRRLRDYYMGH